MTDMPHDPMPELASMAQEPMEPDENSTRERVSVELLLAAESAAQAIKMAKASEGAITAEDAAKWAAAAKDLVDAHVVLSPIVAATNVAQGDSPGQQQPIA